MDNAISLTPRLTEAERVHGLLQGSIVVVELNAKLCREGMYICNRESLQSALVSTPGAAQN